MKLMRRLDGTEGNDEEAIKMTDHVTLREFVEMCFAGKAVAQAKTKQDIRRHVGSCGIFWDEQEYTEDEVVDYLWTHREGYDPVAKAVARIKSDFRDNDTLFFKLTDDESFIDSKELADWVKASTDWRALDPELDDDEIEEIQESVWEYLRKVHEGGEPDRHRASYIDKGVYVTAAEWGKLNGISARRARQLAAQGRIECAEKIGRDWNIPVGAPKPEDPRRK